MVGTFAMIMMPGSAYVFKYRNWLAH